MQDHPQRPKTSAISHVFDNTDSNEDYAKYDEVYTLDIYLCIWNFSDGLFEII